ncbi:hypothetical protein [Dactylosporangium sp. CA-233914]|uniref:hypothetical protein n=1 Tax=Dactylosporangium sp. CA-233914 TaxID=3239934 RepID=UPI003D8CEBBE
MSAPNTTAKVPSHLTEFPGAVGLEFVGDWVQIEPERAEQFYLGTYLDRSYGESLGDGYPDGLIEGFNVLGLLDWMSSELIGRWYGFNYGLDRVRFTKPITLHDRIRLRLRVADARERGYGYLVTYEATVELEGSEKPGMVATWLVLLLPEPHPYDEN